MHPLSIAIAILLLAGLCWKFKFVPFGMTMNFTKSNIFSEPVWLFVAARSSETTAVTLPSLAEVIAGGSATWKNLGGFEKEGLKVNAEVLSMMLQDGTPNQNGVGVKIEAPLAQTDYVNLQLAESFIDDQVDVLLVVIATPTKAYRYKRLGVLVGWQGNHSQGKANVIPVTLQNETNKITSVMDVVTLS